MLRIENLKLPPGSGDAALRAQVLKVLRLPEERLLALRILRRSIDAREGVHWVYTVEAETANEDAVLRRCRDKRVSRAEPRPAYRLPQAVPDADRGTESLYRARGQREYVSPFNRLSRPALPDGSFDG